MTTAQIAVWILEILKEEFAREPDFMKCRTMSELFTTLKVEHGLDDAEINRGLMFLAKDHLITIVDRGDARIAFMKHEGFLFLEECQETERLAANERLVQIEREKAEAEDKKRWTRADKISLASLIFAVVAFFIGLFVGDHLSKKSDYLPAATQQANIISNTSTKSN